MIRRIRDLLYDQGFTISGARNKMQEVLQDELESKPMNEIMLEGLEVTEMDDSKFNEATAAPNSSWQQVRQELFAIRELLSPGL